jgi:hypothetical protein
MAGQQKTLNIGQIIYILSNKSQSVVPAIVAEEDTRKVRKLDGIHEVVNYKLCIGPKERQRVVELNRIDGEVFESLEAIKETLVGRLTSFVDDLVKTTQTNVLNWYGVTADNQALEAGDGVAHSGDKFDPEQLIHAVNNNLPLQNSNQTHPLQLQGGMPQQQQGLNPHATMRDNIRQMVAPEDDGMQGLGLGGPIEHGQTFAVLPDGTRVPVKLNQ